MSNHIQAFLREYASHPRYRAPTGSKLNALSWQTEAPLRMLLNNLDADVAEDPDKLIVYGGLGQAARSEEALRVIITNLLTLREDESLLIQSGKAVARLKTHPEAPRVLIANSNLVPKWANWDHFFHLKEKGLMMYGQMTAGSWIYIGTQGILQGTYETFASLARKHFGGSLAGKIVVTAGLGGMGGAQPLAVTMNQGVILAADVDPQRIEKRINTRYLDIHAGSYEEAKALAFKAKEERRPLSIGITMDIGELLEKITNDHWIPDAATDQTSAHDPLNGYIPRGLTLEAASRLRKENPALYRERSIQSMAAHVGFLLELKRRGTHVFDYGNNLRAFAEEGGEKKAFSIPGFVPEYIRPLFCEGKGPFRWAALSGDPEDIRICEEAILQAFEGNQHISAWIRGAREKVAFQGLPARILWLGLGERVKAGLLFNDLVRQGKLKAPVVIGRDHLDAGSVASPNRETEGMLDGSDAVSDWPLLNLMANTAGGATWVSFHHGGGVGMGYSQHAGMVVLADGTERQENCLRRVLHADPALGVIRHADAGYQEAQKIAQSSGLNLS
ncbi:urocanate hydratase [Estrella lausannensis]|uniref:Urocanate hydratase n=1 Tax=Estrella lausannensis TaxID=483423 RepID=A0A0H5DR77_9BACT|nr:urocanate hydratase [Estrella lausannensis]CRX38673.1 Urocanate hydratase [Estrella lausannensis]